MKLAILGASGPPRRITADDRPGSRRSWSGTASGRPCDLEAFFRLLYRRARDRRRFAVIDELPYLWTAERDFPSNLLKV